MADRAFCGDCGTAVAVDDRFCGACGATQPVDPAPNDKDGLLPADLAASVQGTAEAHQSIASTARVPAPRPTGNRSSRGFLDVVGTTMEVLVRGVYVVICGGVAVLAFQHGSFLVGAGAIAYGLYILAGGRWFIY